MKVLSERTEMRTVRGRDIRLEGLCKSYGERTVLRHLNGVLRQGCVTGVTGPSGCGKTTLLRILLGLEQADAGRITGLEEVRFSAVFQEDRLCGSLSLLTNVRMAAPKGVREDRIREDAGLLGLEGRLDQPVSEFSGGMRRRAAILRAMSVPYDVLVLDEPLKGLDEEAKRKALYYIRDRSRGRTVVIATHERKEAVRLGERREQGTEFIEIPLLQLGEPLRKKITG